MGKKKCPICQSEMKNNQNMCSSACVQKNKIIKANKRWLESKPRPPQYENAHKVSWNGVSNNSFEYVLDRFKGYRG